MAVFGPASAIGNSRHARRRQRSSAALAAFTAAATTAAYVAVSFPVAPAQADTQTTALVGLLEKLDGFVPQLARVGRLAESLPAVAVNPGSEATGVGLESLLAKVLAQDSAGTATSVSDLAGKLDGTYETAGRKFTVTATPSSSAGVQSIDLKVRIDRTLSSAGLDVLSTTEVVPGSPFSLSSPDGVKAVLKADLDVVLNVDAAGSTWITRTANTPKLAFSATGSIPTPADVSAGIGILGVKLAGPVDGDAGTSLALDAAVGTAWSDPDNDGRLYFDQPGGTSGTDGELSASGAGAGLVSAALTGSLTARLKLAADTAAFPGSASLPGVDAVVQVSAPDLAAGAPAVTFDSTAFDHVKGFLTLSPRDLAQGLASVASAVLAAQQDGTALPFMRGDIDSAVTAAESILQFLAETVPAPVPGSSTPGKPSFSSLQQFLTELAKDRDFPGDSALAIASQVYDPTNKKFGFTLTASRTSGEQDLNPTAGGTDGTFDTVTDGGFTDAALGSYLTAPATAALDEARRASLIGRQVIAGQSSAVIKDVTLAGAVTLDGAPLTPAGGTEPAVKWKGGTPAASSPFSIQVDDQKVGLVELGDAIKKSPGDAKPVIGNANAKIASAKVSPSYTLTLPIVLDLQDPKTTGCGPEPDSACPYQEKDATSGITRIITAVPVTADRIKLHTGGTVPLLSANAPISTKVDIDATVGFVGVKLKGDLVACEQKVADDCTGGSGPSQLLTISLLPQNEAAGADAQGDIPVTKLFTRLLTAPASVFDVDVLGQARALLSMSVPGAPDFFGSSTTPTLELVMDDITKPTEVGVTAAGLDNLGPLNFDPENPLALFGALLENLELLQGSLDSVTGSSDALTTRIPVLGKSVSELIASGVSGSGPTVSYVDLSAVAAVAPVAATDSTPATPGSPAIPRMTVLRDTGRVFSDAFVGRRVTVGSASTTIAAVLPDPVDSSKLTQLVLKPALDPDPADGSDYAIESELRGLLNVLQQQPSASLQDMLDLLAKKLGGGSTATFAVVPGTPATLKIDLDWKRGYSATSPLDLKFGDNSLVGTEGGGSLKVDATGRVKLLMELPLSTAAISDPANSLKIDASNSFVDAGVSLTGDGAKLKVNLGPFQASLGDPTAEASGTQLRAGLGVQLKSGSGLKTASAFFGGMAATLNGNGVSCPSAPSAGTTKLALCASFPVFINGTPVTPATDDDNNLSVRLPLGTSLADTVDAAGPAIEGEARITLPAGLEARLAAEALNLLSFGDGFLGYFEFLERSLKVASFEGKLPIVGKDLQAGSEFLTNLRTQIQAEFAALSGSAQTPDAGGIKDFLNTKVVPRLPGAANVKIDLICNVTLGTPTVSADPPKMPAEAVATTDYSYKVRAYTGTDGAPVPGKDSANEVTVKNLAVLSSVASNRITWTNVAFATGYQVLRKKQGETAFTIYKQLPGGSTLSFTDEGGGTTTAYTPATNSPKVTPCPDSASASQIEGFTFTVDFGVGIVTKDGCSGSCLGGKVPLDLGIPGLSIKATDETAGVEGALGYRLHLQLGLTRSDGFFVSTNDSSTPEFAVGASLTVPDVKARLAFIDIDQKDRVAAPKPEFAGQFSIDVVDGCTSSCGAEADRKITLDDLKSQSLASFLKATLEAKVDIDWSLAATASSALPGIGADFRFLWTWAAGADPKAGTIEKLQFNNVRVDAGAFLGKSIRPIVDQVVSIYKPVQPIIDTIFAEVPVISDLSKAVGGDEVTIASLAEAFSTIASGPKLEPFLSVLKNVRDVAKLFTSGIENCPEADKFCLVIGSFDLDTAKALTTDANPSTAKDLVKPIGTITDGAFLGKLSEKLGTTNALVNTKASADSGDTTGASKGFEFPALQQPTKLFGLLLGQDVDLATFDSGPLTLGFKFQKSFGPVYAPPPVNIVVGGGAEVTLRVKAGFDTYGIRTAVESGKLSASVLDSLYFATTDNNGRPLPVVQFKGYLQAGASISAVVIEVGVVGGIQLTVGFFWNDPNNDGKFRFGEFLAAALTNPICLFNVGGELSLFIKVFITLGISPFSVSFDFTLVNIKLLDFSLKPNCTPPPPKLGGVTDDGKLYLFAGKFGNDSSGRPRGDAAWDNKNTAEETWVVRQVPAKDGAPAKVVVQALGITEEFEESADKPIHTVVLDGRGYAGALRVLMQGGEKGTPFTKKAVVFTGGGDDSVRTGEGESFIDAGGGTDAVQAFDRANLKAALTAPAATVSGGYGPDTITVGNAVDKVYGDAGLAGSSHEDPIAVRAADGSSVSLTGALNTATVGAPADPGVEDATKDGIDTITAGVGGSVIYGGAGGDSIGTANDNPQALLPGIKGTSSEDLYLAHKNVIVGGTGYDRIKSGNAGDDIYTGAFGAIGADDLGSADGSDATQANSVDTGAGSDNVYGSQAVDLVTTHSLATQTATVYGGGGKDVIIGGAGTDRLFGGPANDYLVAEPATVSNEGGTTDALGTDGRLITPLSGAPTVTEKVLAGGGGSDRIYGADGPALIFGDQYRTNAEKVETERCVLGSDPISTEPAYAAKTDGTTDVNDARDLILGGNGPDTVTAGGGNDLVYAAGAKDVLCGNQDLDEVYGGGDDDVVYGGSQDDKVYGEQGADKLFGNGGDDSVFGGTEKDLVEGNAGDDFLSGGTEDDVVIGGSSKAGLADGDDRVYGDLGTDTLFGDNASGSTAEALPTDLAVDDVTSTLGGTDSVFGGDGPDQAFGGIQDDVVLGGTGSDDLEGNGGSDRVTGESGDDDIVGGSSQEASTGVGFPDDGDVLDGNDGGDVIAGDNATIANAITEGTHVTKGRGLEGGERLIVQLDLGDIDPSANYGGDTVHGGLLADVVLGQRGADVLHGDEGQDYVEGGPNPVADSDPDTVESDRVFGEAGDDELVGGSYVGGGTTPLTAGQPDARDEISAGDGNDVVLGDNGLLLRKEAGLAASPLTQGRDMLERTVVPFDSGRVPATGHFGGDEMLGGNGSDVMLGQRGNDVLKGEVFDDYLEGGQDSDRLEGGVGDDDLVGGSYEVEDGTGQSTSGQYDGGDMVFGGPDGDVVLGDNGELHRAPGSPKNDVTLARDIGERTLRPYDLGDAPKSATSGGDFVHGDEANDVVFGQDGPDRVFGDDGDDYAEGGQDADWIEGGAASDDLVGGSSSLNGSDVGDKTVGQRDGIDVVFGQTGNDLVLGDNAVSTRVGAFDPLTDRLDGPAKVAGRAFRLLDLRTNANGLEAPTGGRFGGDLISGQEGVDVLLGQDGPDKMSGGSHEDYAEGQGGDDLMAGDRPLSELGVAQPTGAWPGDPSAGFAADAGQDVAAGEPRADGQDDLLGGKSEELFRDGADRIVGDGNADFQLGDNGRLLRDVLPVAGSTDLRYARYDAYNPLTVVRRAYRFDVNANDRTNGPDLLEGNDGDDYQWGQDDGDEMYGNAGNDDMYGELGADTMFGGAGEDAMVGDRGGIVDTKLTSTDAAARDTTQGPTFFDYQGRWAGQLDRRVDLYKDDVTTGAKMPFNGLDFGAADYMRGGSGHDSMHGGFGDDLMNGDSGGDFLFGADGRDAMWGGAGLSGVPYSLTPARHVSDPKHPDFAQGIAKDNLVDILFGGVSGSTADTADVMDYRPRGTAATCGNPAANTDPCSWLDLTGLRPMTQRADGSALLGTEVQQANQHHQGIDWIYGGQGRDVLQGDVGKNGPDLGDRLMDWDGAWNLYTRCNASYGDDGDVRQHSPDTQRFMTTLAYGSGIGATKPELGASGSSPFRELAYVYNGDKGNSGKAFPTTPGHYEQPSCVE